VADRIEFLPRGPRSLTTRATLLAELSQVRRTGIASNDEELDSGLRSIAGCPSGHGQDRSSLAINLASPVPCWR